jgi:hypothetical protein
LCYEGLDIGGNVGLGVGSKVGVGGNVGDRVGVAVGTAVDVDVCLELGAHVIDGVRTSDDGELDIGVGAGVGV